MKVEGTIVDELTAKKQTEEALAELMKVDDTHNMSFHKVLVEKNGQMVEIEVPIDDINLLDDFDDEDEVAATDVAAMYAPRNNTTSLMITVLR